MKRSRLVAALIIAVGSAANAATLVVVPDQSTYVVGETVTLTITGDPQGAQDDAIFGRLEYDPSSTSTLGSSQTRHTSGGGASSAILGIVSFGDGFVDVFNQIVGFEGPLGVDQVQVAEATLVADAIGAVEVYWSNDVGYELHFFGLTSSTVPLLATSFDVVPEPAHALQQAAVLGVLVFLHAIR
jgi:hypothetical protein